MSLHYTQMLFRSQPHIPDLSYVQLVSSKSKNASQQSSPCSKLQYQECGLSSIRRTFPIADVAFPFAAKQGIHPPIVFF